MLIMKYLRIHLIIWCLPCIIYTLFEIAVFLAFNIISFILNGVPCFMPNIQGIIQLYYNLKKKNDNRDVSFIKTI